MLELMDYEIQIIFQGYKINTLSNSVLINKLLLVDYSFYYENINPVLISNHTLCLSMNEIKLIY